MTPSELKAVLDRDPFTPVRLAVRGGAGYDVTNPATVRVGARLVFIGRRRDGGDGPFDDPVFIDLRDVAGAAPINQAEG